MELTRKEFLISVLGLAAGSTAVAACGDDTGDGAGGAGGGSTSGDTSADTSSSATTGTPSSSAATTSGGGDACESTIATNHGHVLNVSQADVDAAADKTYDIMGTSPHTHSVTVTAADFATLAGGGSVTVTSTETNAHTHSVTVQCG